MQSQGHHLAQINCQQKPTVEHFLNEITKITCFIAIFSEASCCVVFWRFTQLWGSVTAGLACQWSVPLSECSPSVNEEQLERDKS